VDSYWHANMEILAMSQAFLSDIDWPLYTRETEGPPTKVCNTASVTNCLISDGCKIEGQVERSILSPGVEIQEGAIVRDSIIMNDTVVGRDSVINSSILDKEVFVQPQCHIGTGNDYHINRGNPNVLKTGLTIVGKGAVIPPGTKIGRNCIIYDSVTEGDFLTSEIASGETIKPKRKPIRIRA
jgi:glucose-1-phosphate adenylyltransferase